MKYLFDTSVCIAGFIKNHPNHAIALSWLQKGKEKTIQFYICAHSILEIYSVLTRAPFQPRITPSMAKEFIKHNLKSNATILTLTQNDYFILIDKMVNLELSGGIIYDGMIVQCAEKHRIDNILTLNHKDFIMLTPNKNINIISL